MKYFVKWSCMGKMPEGGPVKLEEDFSKQIHYIEKSGKMKDGGPLLGTKGGYFVFDIKEPGELLGLLGRVFYDNFDIEIHPVLSYKELTEYLHKEYAKAA
jgi:hypothetical protein